MHWIKVTRPRYEQSKLYKDQVGEVIGSWGPENSADARPGYLVEFSNGEVVGIAENELEMTEPPPMA